MTLQAPMGGSEILYQALADRVDLSSINLIKSVCAWELLDNRPNVLWQHLNTDENTVKLLADPQFVARLDKIVFVSDWQKIKFIRTFNLPIHKCVTIRNAIEPIPAHKKPEKIRLIYTSTPWRGLHLLIEAFKVLDRDVELVVYSGTSIYGKDFHEQTKDQFQRLYEELKALDVTHIEYAPNDEVRKALTQAHILAYPNTWEETSCLSAIEALAAGCKVVTTPNGALPETCGDWADYAELEDYVAVLRNAIDNYKYNQDQVDFYNTNYSWDARVEEWRALIESLNTVEHKLYRLKDSGLQINKFLDIGAYRGEFTKAVKQVWPDVSVTQIEADERQKQYLDHDAKFLLLGDSNREVDFYTLEDTGYGRTTGSSIYLENTEHYKNYVTIKKQMVRFDDVIRFEDWSSGMIKLDTQGSELDILRGAKKFLHECKPRYILMECSIQKYNHGAPLVDESIKTLRQYGYEPKVEFDKVLDQNGQILQTDILFERRNIMEFPQKMKRVIIGTPALTGELEVRYVNSLIQAVKLCLTQNIILEPLFVSYDALIQRARNDTLAIALEKGVDALVFIDQDIMFDPEWVLRLINRTEDVVGGTYRKKTDEEELYVVTGNDLTVHTNGLIKVHSLGTGFVKLSRRAMQALWDNSEEYENEGKIRRMICNVSVVNGFLVSEDVMMFKKLTDLGFDVWLNPSMTCGHVGTKLFLGDFQDFSNRLSNVMPSKINRL